MSVADRVMDIARRNLPREESLRLVDDVLWQADHERRRQLHLVQQQRNRDRGKFAPMSRRLGREP